jgi:hypothetical protein
LVPFPFPLFAAAVGSIGGARLFHRTFGFNVGSTVFRTGASGIRGGGALARRSAGFGTRGAIFGTGFGISFAITGSGSAIISGSANSSGLVNGSDSAIGSDPIPVSGITNGSGSSTGSGFATGCGFATTRGFGFGKATSAGLLRTGSIISGSGSGSMFFCLREAATVFLKCSGKL